jgi:succinoglycan biosynthesis transport protein ExoP
LRIRRPTLKFPLHLQELPERHRRDLIGSLGHDPCPEEADHRDGRPRRDLWLLSGRDPAALYTAGGTIEIRSGSSNEYRIGLSPQGGDSRLPTEVAILKSNSLLLSVARDRNLANDPAFWAQSGRYQNVDDPVVRQRVVGALQAKSGVGVIPKTDLVSITCTTGKAQLSADIVNQLVQDYIAHSFQSRADATKRVQAFFSSQLDDLKQQVETSQEQMLGASKEARRAWI